MTSSNFTRWLLAGCLVVALTTTAFMAGLATGFGLGRWTAPAVVVAPAAPQESPAAVVEAPRVTAIPAATQAPPAILPTPRP
ncbi:MAG: hypothetical protein WA089_12880, partial [Anaerolineae bacterium]